jgi:hypothetical protein
MLIDIYAISPGIYWFVHYTPDLDEKADVLRARLEGAYLTTTNNASAADDVAREDFRGPGGMVTRLLPLEEAMTRSASLAARRPSSGRQPTAQHPGASGESCSAPLLP